ncbi:hypothetical protein JVU11DRAFT_11892 [Chiua virens]|nr:hypothetical protein JVU11DRAFT_11892 [Chiua virens]
MLIWAWGNAHKALVPGSPLESVVADQDLSIGKSSLIKKAMGVECESCDTTRGETNIEHEYIAKLDPRFIVHDSRGFEAAEKQNVEDAQKFVQERVSKPDLEDQLHAVWLCLEIPYAGARLIESAGEKFLKGRKEILGNIPLIVVFSKHDLLVNLIEVESSQAKITLSKEEWQAEYDRLLKMRCLVPIEKKAGGPVPHVEVSSRDGYEMTLEKLRNETVKLIQTYIKNEPALNAAMARRNESKSH